MKTNLTIEDKQKLLDILQGLLDSPNSHWDHDGRCWCDFCGQYNRSSFYDIEHLESCPVKDLPDVHNKIQEEIWEHEEN